MKKAGMCVVISAAVAAEVLPLTKADSIESALKPLDVEGSLISVKTDIMGTTTIAINEKGLIACIKFGIKMWGLINPVYKAMEAMMMAIMPVIAHDSKMLKKEIESISKEISEEIKAE